MSDPYSILGVSENASDDEIKKAYRELARKFHPDNYHDNPLSDLAQEKMKEINEAYDEITRTREGKGSYNARRGYSGASTSSPEGAKVREAINAGKLTLAQELLEAFPNNGAEWHFLMGSLYFRKGWLDEAWRFYQAAVRLEPNNPEYRQALNYMNRGGGLNRPYAHGGITPVGCDACDICAAMMCVNMCCRC